MGLGATACMFTGQIGEVKLIDDFNHEARQVIGYVGSTGWSTGPHAHYEFKIAGVQQDPQGRLVPVAMPVLPT